jgi:hypothetical protein
VRGEQTLTFPAYVSFICDNVFVTAATFRKTIKKYSLDNNTQDGVINSYFPYTMILQSPQIYVYFRWSLQMSKSRFY